MNGRTGERVKNRESDRGPVLKPERSGVYLAPRQLRALRDAAAKARLAWLELETARVRDKEGFLETCALDLDFPDWFGANWDALADCLKDLSWQAAPGYVILWRGGAALAGAAPDDFATALEIFRDAATYWKERDAVFLALLDHEPAGTMLPRLPGA